MQKDNNVVLMVPAQNCYESRDQVLHLCSCFRDLFKTNEAMLAAVCSERDAAIQGWESEAALKIQAEDSERAVLQSALQQNTVLAELQCTLTKKSINKGKISAQMEKVKACIAAYRKEITCGIFGHTSSTKHRAPVHIAVCGHLHG